MKQTMLLKLHPTTEQHQALLDTMHAFNQAATYVAEIAFAEKTAGKWGQDIAGFRAKREQLARRVSSTTIEQLKGRERGELSRSAIVNMDRPAPLFVRRMFGHKDRTVS